MPGFMSDSKSRVLGDTIIEALTGNSGWRKIILGCSQEGVATLETWIEAQRGRGFALSSEQVASDTKALGQRRVVLLIEPEDA